jgi:hypothetical protein
VRLPLEHQIYSVRRLKRNRSEAVCQVDVHASDADDAKGSSIGVLALLIDLYRLSCDEVRKGFFGSIRHANHWMV